MTPPVDPSSGCLPAVDYQIAPVTAKRRLYNIRIDIALFLSSLVLAVVLYCSWGTGNFADRHMFALAVTALGFFLFGGARSLGVHIGCAIALAIIVCCIPTLLYGICSRVIA